jgi:hypothetical protein
VVRDNPHQVTVSPSGTFSVGADSNHGLVFSLDFVGGTNPASVALTPSIGSPVTSGALTTLIITDAIGLTN